MEPITPVVNGMESEEIIFAKDQPQYRSLPALRSNREDRRILTRWKISDEERAAISAGADLFLEVATFGNPLQPICLFFETDNEELLKYVVEEYR